jgi:hypothetical protein
LKSRKLKLGGSLEKVDAKVYLHYLDIANPCKGNTDLYLEPVGLELPAEGILFPHQDLDSRLS